MDIIYSNKQLIGNFIIHQLYLNNELNQHNTETKKLNKFQQLYPHSVLSKYIETPIHVKDISPIEIYKFYQPIYFPNLQLNQLITQRQLENLKQLCQTLNIWSKTEIYVPNNLHKKISCIDKEFQYYKFNIFGSYYHLNQSIIPTMYIHKYRNIMICNIQDICVFWRNIYLFYYKSYNRKTLKEFKNVYKKFVMRNIIKIITELKEYSNNINDIFLEINCHNTLEETINNIKYIESGLVEYNLNHYRIIEPYCKRINDISNMKNKYPKCFLVNESKKLITFEFELLKYL